MSINDNARISVFPRGREPARDRLREAVARASTRVAPLWPLENFVAVNPFLGFTDEPFAASARRLRAACDAPLYQPRSVYAAALEEGRITREDLQVVIDRRSDDQRAAQGIVTATQLELHAQREEDVVEPFPTVADVCGGLSDTDWPALVTQRISHWAAGYFDAGQASWASPFRDASPYAAWLEEARIDCSDTVYGLDGAQDIFAGLPNDAEALQEEALRQLAVPEEQLDLYLHRLLMSIGGWVAHARYRSWREELGGARPAWVGELLAIRLAWELVLLRGFDALGAPLAWRRGLLDAGRRFDEQAWENSDAHLDQLLQEAYEYAWERELTADMRSARQRASGERPEVQAVFCIDVRSEVLRRALEAGNERVETLGFAGFFGLPIEYVPLANDSGAAHCPVLLQPALSVREGAAEDPAVMNNRLTRRIRLRRQLGRGWRAFKNSAVSCFVFVESYGLAYAWKLVSHTLGLSRPEPLPTHRGLPAYQARQLGPQLVVSDGEEGGVALEQQVEFAESMLRGMSLTDNFARLVMLTGHGSSTTNNAHGSGLDCGACGGQTGEASARVAAMILNNPAVRDGLRERGIDIPADSHFIAALHITTTDAVELYDVAAVPVTHREDLQALRARLGDAGERARGERAKLLGLPPRRTPLDGVLRKSRDWSEVRPEWGLAGCAGFIAAPRSWTRGMNLEGRSFLHSYDHRNDRDFATLELIMSAPMVVASWINLQYYGSSVANEVFGSGDKTLHNVVGATLGVLEGNGGDLRTGLPLQSVHNGERLQHEPMRLNVFLAAPIAAINAILERNEVVRELVENGWVKLFAVYDEGSVIARYAGDLWWEPVSAPQ